MQAKAERRQKGPAQGELGAGGSWKQLEAGSREQVEAGSREQVEAGSRGGWEQAEGLSVGRARSSSRVLCRSWAAGQALSWRVYRDIGQRWRRVDWPFPAHFSIPFQKGWCPPCKVVRIK